MRHDDEHLLTTEHQVECCERAHIMANRVQYSRGYFYFYGLLIALNVLRIDDCLFELRSPESLIRQPLTIFFFLWLLNKIDNLLLIFV